MTLNVAVDVNNPNVVSKELVLDLFEPESASSKNSDRRDVEKFIHRVFSRAYGADLNHYLPRLMSLRNPDNRVIAALGMREASSGPLFLETYLDSPVEHVISRLSDTLTTRKQIMEVGNLASMHRGGLRNLIIALTSYLRGAGSEWVVFTAVPAVRNAFEALDLPLYTLAVADKSRLDEKERAKLCGSVANNPDTGSEQEAQGTGLGSSPHTENAWLIDPSAPVGSSRSGSPCTRAASAGGTSSTRSMSPARS